jgi:hypothetical protein
LHGCQIFIKIAVSFSFLVLFVRCSPFAATEVDYMSGISQLCTLISLMYALCIQIGVSTGARHAEHAALPP